MNSKPSEHRPTHQPSGGRKAAWAILLAGLGIVLVLLAGAVTLLPKPPQSTAPRPTLSPPEPTTIGDVAPPPTASLPEPTAVGDIAPPPTASPPEPTVVSTQLPSVVGDVAPPVSVFGVEMGNVDNGGGLAEALEAGVHWVRFHAFYWDEIEPVRTDPPTYHWEVVDEQSLLNAQANGLEVIAIVHFVPEWAQKYAGSFCGPIGEDALAAYSQFVTGLVRRYGASPYNIRYWELGNEPDAPLSFDRSVFGCWGEAGDEYFGGGYYAEMLKAAYPSIKAVDPHAQVLIGGLALDCGPTHPPADKDCRSSKFLEGILHNGGGPYFDAVNFHAYTYRQMANPNWPGSATSVPEKTAFIRQVLEQYGHGDKALFNTEIALQCWNATDECQEAQAMYVPRVYAEALALGLEAQVYYAMINEAWRHTGLLLLDLTPKPVYHAYRTAAHFLGSAVYAGKASGYPSGLDGFTFHRSDTQDQVDVIWSDDGSVQELSLPTGALAYDRYGDLVASSGVILVDQSPVYVVKP